jgi:MSHA pilin protein MshD
MSRSVSTGLPRAPLWARLRGNGQRVQARTLRHRPRQGFTLIDLLIVIVLTGIVAGTMTVVFSRLAEQSAQGLREQQAQVLAQGLLAEVRAMPFTYCDPQDARVASATRARLGAADCATQVDGLGPEPGESRTNAAARFDGVSDYQNFQMPGPGCASLCDRNGLPLPVAGVLAACSANVQMAPLALPGVPALDADGRPQALAISVRVACPGMATAIAEGVRLRHSPNAV